MIYWVRHCSTTGQEPEAPLTLAGEAQARTLAQTLKAFAIERIVSSPYRRAIQSIEPFAAASGLVIQTDVRLRERVLSAQALSDWQQVLRQTFEDQDFAAPGGECSRTAADRGEAAFRDCINSGKTTVIVSHGNLTCLLLRRLDWPMDYDAALRLTNPDVFAINPRGSNFDITRLWH
jgi:2,3-bisphosphoglycerate-dependent phosphoglycerate mutase